MIQKELTKEAISGNQNNYKTLTHCPYCQGKIVKRGVRKKKYEKVQIYYCKNCNKRFTSLITKHKTYPLRVIIDAITLYNRLNPLEDIPKMIKDSYGITITRQTISNWLKEYAEFIPFLRMKEFAEKNYTKKELIEEAKIVHKQIYDFKFHRAKLDMILEEEYRHYRFKPLKEFLELVTAECPHELFRNTTNRVSEFKDVFNLDEVKIVPKNNTATKIANFVTQAISNNKLRHQILQNFMLTNDSVTIATEVPVLINNNDIRHYKHELNFNIPLNLKDQEYITGHIDLIQVRNGAIYIIDFKPSANKQKPVAQLALYALSLSRLTGIRLYHFKCAWFDEKNYFEFFPLHIVYKLRKKKKGIDKKQKRLLLPDSKENN